MTVLQACEKARQSKYQDFVIMKNYLIAGNCRMCLVEMEKSPKPVASCAMPAAKMKV